MHGSFVILVFGAAESVGAVQRHAYENPINWEQADRLVGGCGMVVKTHILISMGSGMAVKFGSVAINFNNYLKVQDLA